MSEHKVVVNIGRRTDCWECNTKNLPVTGIVERAGQLLVTFMCPKCEEERANKYDFASQDWGPRS